MKMPIPLVIAVSWVLAGQPLPADEKPAAQKPPVAAVEKPPVDNMVWTPWMTDGDGPDEYHEHWLKMVKLKCYSPFVEGRMFGGREEYRAIFRPLTSFPYAWMSYHGMDDEFFNEQDRKLTKLGYERLCYQAFVTDEGVVRIQATWFKNREALKRDPHYSDGDGNIVTVDWKKYSDAAR